MGGFGWALYCRLSIWYLKMRFLSLNVTFRIEQERPFSSEATMSPKISSSRFFTFSENIIDFFWRCLLIVLLNHPVGWYLFLFFFFCFFSLPERQPDTIMDSLWFLLELSLALVMLGLIFLLMDCSDAFDSASDILPVSSSEIAGILSFLCSSSLLLSMLS